MTHDPAADEMRRGVCAARKSDKFLCGRGEIGKLGEFRHGHRREDSSR